MTIRFVRVPHCLADALNFAVVSSHYHIVISGANPDAGTVVSLLIVFVIASFLFFLDFLQSAYIEYSHVCFFLVLDAADGLLRPDESGSCLCS